MEHGNIFSDYYVDIVEQNRFLLVNKEGLKKMIENIAQFSCREIASL